SKDSTAPRWECWVTQSFSSLPRVSTLRAKGRRTTLGATAAPPSAFVNSPAGVIIGLVKMRVVLVHAVCATILLAGHTTAAIRPQRRTNHEENRSDHQTLQAR